MPCYDIKVLGVQLVVHALDEPLEEPAVEHAGKAVAHRTRLDSSRYV